MATDVLTVATQNLVLAFNSLNKTQQYLAGQYTSKTYSVLSPPAGVQVYIGRSRIVAANIVVTGGTVEIYNTASTSALLTENLVYAFDASSTLGNHPIGIECANGIVIKVDGTTSINLSYSVY